MEKVVDYIRSFQTLDEWLRFVQCEQLWEGQPDLIRELEYKWLGFAATEDQADDGHPEFWQAVSTLNQHESLQRSKRSELAS
jgi:hypothetical protein